MKTYQDLKEVGENEQGRIDFVKSAIADHKSCEMYNIAFAAEEYYKRMNISIMQYQKVLYTMTGKAVPDLYSPNHKLPSNFFRRFVIQENQYLLGNGVTLEDSSNKDRLGKNFDYKLQQMGRNALVEGISFGFWNLDHLEVFRLTEFVPLWDEETGALRAGIRFFQIDADKPLRATLFEEDGYTDYIQKNDKPMEVMNQKRNYQEIVKVTPADGMEIVDGKNYPGFPVIPMWGNDCKQSEFIGLREYIDAYDLIESGFANDMDGEQIYWILKNSGGMDDVDLMKFKERLRILGAATPEDDSDVQAHEVPIPYEARVKYLERLEQDMYNDYQALNVTNFFFFFKSSTEINSAYQPFDDKVDQYEYCVLEFLDGLFQIVGIDDNPSFTRNKVANQSDNMSTLMMAEPVLDEEFMTKKATAILGDPDAAQDILDRKAGMDLDRLTGGNVEDEDDGEEESEQPEEAAD